MLLKLAIKFRNVILFPLLLLSLSASHVNITASSPGLFSALYIPLSAVVFDELDFLPVLCLVSQSRL